MPKFKEKLKKKIATKNWTEKFKMEIRSGRTSPNSILHVGIFDMGK